MKSKIAKALLDEEVKSERISSTIQLLLFSSLFVVYLLTPKGFDSTRGIWFEPVKLLFYFYIPLLILRLIHTRRREDISLWYYVYLVVDIVSITALIFSYHVQYQRPFSLSLHSPTFLYYFVFIALRCLSYDPRKVFFVGSLSALAWGSLTAYGLTFGSLLRTRNFADFTNPSMILVGVEIDKILSILLVTGICTAAVYRKRRLLAEFSQRSVYNAAMERLVGKDAFKAMSERNGEFSPGVGARRMATTMMVDLRGFSKLSYEIEPERIVDYLGQYHRIVATQVFKNGGSVDKYMGDGVLAHFGAVTVQGQHSANALKASEDIYFHLNQWRTEVATQGIKFDFGVAVSIGEVIFGTIGHEDRMEITVIGEAVNLSAKLEKHTKVLRRRIVTTLKTFETAKAEGFKPTIEVSSFLSSEVGGIPHRLDLVGLGEAV